MDSCTLSSCCVLAGEVRMEVLCCLLALPALYCRALVGLWPLGMQLQIARHTSKAVCRSCSEKIQLQELVYRKEKDLCLNAYAGFCAFTHSDSRGLGIPSEQRCC